MKTKHVLLLAFFILLTAYSLYQGRYLIFGPHILITAPKDGTVLTGPVVTITGVASNTAWLSLDDSPIFTDQKGHFSEKLIVATGTSIIELKARDHFGREIEKSIRVILN